MSYRAPLQDIAFTLDHMVGARRLSGTALFAEATADLRKAILAGAARIAEEAFAPLNRSGDLERSELEDGAVRTPAGFRDALAAFASGGFIGMTARPEHGGLGLPLTFASPVNEMIASANLSLSLAPLLAQGQIEALEAFAPPRIKALYLPKLAAGEWLGTMNLTEPQAGTDLAAIATRAEPQSDGTFAITGQKIFITWGDHDLTENISHLVLARIPDGPEGVKGLSVFVVPKFLPDAHGAPGTANAITTVSLEHKLGLRASPTAVMAFQDAKGWLVGEAHGGIEVMFRMMNNARLGVGLEGVGAAERASQKALAYAIERKQGASPIADGTGAIVDHADVRRMLLTQRALTATARAICYDCAFSFDIARGAEGAESDAWAARGALLTPIAKAYGTDAGIAAADLGIQIHGGLGFIEETGAAQILRDVRVTSIYEGTNGIQAMDLVGRKMADGGTAARALLEEVAQTVRRANQSGHPQFANVLKTARDSVAGATEVLQNLPENDRFAGASHYLKAFALVLGGHYLLRAALADTAWTPLARFHLLRMAPQAITEAAAGVAGGHDLYAANADALGSR